MTNGEELGDPECLWVEGDADPSGDVTHPGICTPLDDAACIEVNSWLDCDALLPFECQAFNHTGISNLLHVKLHDVHYPIFNYNDI